MGTYSNRDFYVYDSEQEAFVPVDRELLLDELVDDVMKDGHILDIVENGDTPEEPMGKMIGLLAKLAEHGVSMSDSQDIVEYVVDNFLN